MAIAAELTMAALLAACVHTVPFRSADGAPVPGSVATMEFIRLRGVE